MHPFVDQKYLQIDPVGTKSDPMDDTKKWRISASKFTRSYLLNHKRYQAHLLTRERGLDCRKKIALAAGYEFSFKFRTRVARQGGFAPLKSPTGGRAPRPPPYFIAFLNAEGWADFCVKILNRNLQRWRSYGLPKIYTNFALIVIISWTKRDGFGFRPQ